jgi:hypothetical protein
VSIDIHHGAYRAGQRGDVIRAVGSPRTASDFL